VLQIITGGVQGLKDWVKYVPFVPNEAKLTYEQIELLT